MCGVNAMTTERELLDYAAAGGRGYYSDEAPIFEIMLFEHPNKEMILDSGRKSGIPDLGGSYVPGFYHDLSKAINALHENCLDIRETVYDAAFIICRFPGLYKNPGREGRMYFVFDKDKDGYFEAAEPAIFAHMAY